MKLGYFILLPGRQFKEEYLIPLSCSGSVFDKMQKLTFRLLKYMFDLDITFMIVL